MKTVLFRKLNLKKPYTISRLWTLFVATVCYFLTSIVGYQVIALILLVTVSLSAKFFDMKPVLVAAVLSVLVWNFFFIPPKFTFAIRIPEEGLMYVMYLMMMLTAVFSIEINQFEKEANWKEEEESTPLFNLHYVLVSQVSKKIETERNQPEYILTESGVGYRFVVKENL